MGELLELDGEGPHSRGPWTSSIVRVLTTRPRHSTAPSRPARNFSSSRTHLTSLSLSPAFSLLFPSSSSATPPPFHPFISHSSIRLTCHATPLHQDISAIHQQKRVPSFDSLFDEMDDIWNFNPNYANWGIIIFIMIAALEGHECVSPAGGTPRSYHHEAFTRRMRAPPDGTFQLTSRPRHVCTWERWVPTQRQS